MDNHVRYRLRRWLKAKYKVRGPGKTRFPKGYLYEDLGLLQPPGLVRQLSVCERVSEPCPRAGCLNTGPSGSMSGEWKRGTARLVRHRQTKGPATDRPSLNHRATPRLYMDQLWKIFHNCSVTIGTPRRSRYASRLPG